MYKELERLIDGYLTMGVPGFDCILLKDGECVFRHSGGYADVAKKTPIDRTERFNIYSSSKMITCTAALQLWEKGLYALDDPLGDYIPEFREMTVRCGDEIRPARKPIRIHHLFEMTAGFSYDTNSPHLWKVKEETSGKCSTRDVILALAKEPLLFEPGERWEYSLCHDVLAYLVETLSGMRFSEYVKKHIFEPLGMTSASFCTDEEELGTIAPMYGYNAQTGALTDLGRTLFNRNKGFGSAYESGGADCVCTLDDFVKFLEALRVGDIILKKETVDMMVTDRLTEQQRKTYWWGHRSGYGLGVQCPKAGESGFFSWGGATGSYPLVDREKGLTFFYVRHVLGMNNDYFNDLMAEHVRKIASAW